MYNKPIGDAATRRGLDFFILLFVLTSYVVLRAIVAGVSVETVANSLLFVLMGMGGIAAFASMELRSREGNLRRAFARYYTWRRAVMIVLGGLALSEALMQLA